MSQHHDSHGGGGTNEWLATHMGGIIMPFGEVFEKVIDKLMVFAVNGAFKKIAGLYLVIFSPIVVLEFLLYLVKS